MLCLPKPLGGGGTGLRALSSLLEALIDHYSPLSHCEAALQHSVL